jgi:Zn-dependent protease/CBS domain-containing protein
MRVGSIFGISITVNASWIFIFALVAWSFSNPNGPLRVANLGVGERLALGILASLLFFVSVLAHELAHSLVARSRGIPVSGITLFIFGGVSAIEGEPSTAPGEAWISGVGPLTSLLIGFALVGLWRLLHAPAGAFGAIALYLGIANVGLAIFNILPAYPLDGGRVMHALLWRLTGDRERATRITVLVGRALAALLIAYGIVLALASDFGSGLWLTFIGWFLLQSGAMEQSRITIAHALEGHAARELAAPQDVRLPANATGAEARTYFAEHDVRAVPVFVGDTFIGVLTADELAKVGPNDLEHSYVTSLMKRAENVKSIAVASSAADAVRDMARDDERVYALTGEHGEFGGLFTRESVLAWLGRAAGAKAPSRG